MGASLLAVAKSIYYISERAKMKSYTMVSIDEKVPCELKDHRQHGPIKQRHNLTNVSAR